MLTQFQKGQKCRDNFRRDNNVETISEGTVMLRHFDKGQ